MANRRDFLAVAGGVGLASMWGSDAARAADDKAERELYELRRYLIADEEQKRGFDAFLKGAAIPALNRLGIEPVGVFYAEKDLSPIFVLLRHRSLESVLTLTHKLMADTEYLAKGAAVINAPADKPAYQRMESSLLLAFKGMPTLTRPAKGPGRVFQLRTYESPSVKTGQKKIEMFNDAGELALFKRVGLNPVFFGESIIGAKMPNLTYMLGFESEDEKNAAWKKFLSDPEWKRLSGMPEYMDKNILCKNGVTNLVVKPAAYSQI